MTQSATNRQYDSVGKAYSFQNRYIKELIAGIPSIVHSRMQEGWTACRLGIMFKQMPVDGRLAIDWMKRDIAAFHRTLTHRSLRRAHRPAVSDKRPIFFGAPDIGGSGSGQRKRKVAGGDIRINDGLHYDSILLIPPRTRLKMPLLNDSLDRYCHPDSWIALVHCEPLDYLDRAVSYTFKWSNWHTPQEDSLIFLPDSTKSGLQIQAQREQQMDEMREQIARLKKMRLSFPRLAGLPEFSGFKEAC